VVILQILGTSEIMAYKMTHDDMTVHLIDTPGFNDTYKTEMEVLQEIAHWLADTYEQSTKLNGIIYLHSINNVKMEGSALRNLKMFRNLCGDDPLGNVILTTTFWTKVDDDTARRREKELQMTPDFWGRMLDKGSRMERFVDRESALRIISSLLRKEPVPLQIQKEMVEQEKTLINTAAGQIVNEELARLEEKHCQEKARLETEMKAALEQQDHQWQDILVEELQKRDRELDKVRRQQEQLRADRRADLRRLENDRDQAKRNQETLREELLNIVQEMTLQQALAIVRANEAKLSPTDRILLENKISEVEELPQMQEKKRSGRKLGKIAGKILLKALEVVVPTVTGIFLGVPIHFPLSSLFSPNASNDSGDNY
jgi:hypothetical protein